MKDLLSYSNVGTGAVVVLLHGFCESKALWKEFEKPLLQNYQIITPDLPGHGESKINAEQITSIEYMADKVYELLTSLGIVECILIGHSLGGYVTLAFAEKYPTLLKGFGLFHASAFEDSEAKKQNRNKTIDFIQKHGMAQFAASFTSPLFYHKNRQRLSPEIERMQTICRNTPAETAIATTAAMRDRKERIGVLKQANVPVLFLAGKEDNAVPLKTSLEQCYLPKEHTVIFLEETGHMGMFEKKEVAQEGIIHFLEEIYKS